MTLPRVACRELGEKMVLEQVRARERAKKLGEMSLEQGERPRPF
jgi:hypothetical protein